MADLVSERCRIVLKFRAAHLLASKAGSLVGAVCGTAGRLTARDGSGAADGVPCMALAVHGDRSIHFICTESNILVISNESCPYPYIIKLRPPLFVK